MTTLQIKPQQKKAKLSSLKEKTFVLLPETKDDAKTTKFLETFNSAEANITEKELQGSKIWEDILLEQTKAFSTITEETNNICQNNNDTADEHVSNQNSQSGNNNQDTDPLPQTTMTKILLPWANAVSKK
ncbi:24044_t:CDS:2 [Cetraspora pellucida]|uniref:24044_t:CDS:1 n=1 Tax=Cetraspora pellucida TaxID=1433469 RepID=A0A9N9K494_9GLOM|nr:24044_t:CDS:2 [Cetraspora pellucida]